MNIASRFERAPENAPTVRIEVNGETLVAKQGISLAAALLAQSGNPSRKTAKGNDRTAYCMMGVCFDCLVEVDGVANTQACMTLVRDGMIVSSQAGLRGLGGGQDV